ncbi:MAG: sulfatase [Rikenellaceae bacterium]
MNPKLLLPLLPLMAVAAPISAAKKTKGESLPNIIVINLDDVGYGDFSYNGAIGYTTPNVDRMVAEGMQLSQFEAAASVSGPSRAGLMTGCYPMRVGFKGNPMPNSKNGVDTAAMTMAELLKQRGYVTAAYGKWHLGHTTEMMPLQRGFDEFCGLPYSHDMWLNHPQNSKYKFGDLPSYEGNEIVEYNIDPARYTTEYTERVVEFVERNKKSPFFVYLAHPMAHTPLGVSDKFKGRSEAGIYGDVMMEIDWSVGQILEVLRREGIEERTLVVLTSDNGPALMYGEHAGCTNGLREGKGVKFEGGHRVPCVFYWRGVVKGGTTCNKLTSNLDLFATAAELAGAPLPTNIEIDGVSLVPLIRGEEGANPRKHFAYYTSSVAAVSNGLYKLVLPHTYTSVEGMQPGVGGVPGEGRHKVRLDHKELYDLRRDAGERYNVIEYNPDVVAELEPIAAYYQARIGQSK